MASTTSRVSGDPAQMTNGATAASGAATQAGNQSAAVKTALAAIPPIVEVGPAADQLREFGGKLQKAYTEISQAYEQVSAKLKVVAKATADAKQADTKAQGAKKDLATAKAKLARDQATLATAEQAVTAAKTGLVIGANPMAPPAGPTPAQLAAVQTAKDAVTADTKAVQEKTEAYQRDEKAYQTANEEREKQLNQFTDLCSQLAAKTSAAIPQAPDNIVDIQAVQSLSADVFALQGLPVLADSGFAIAHLGQVQTALHNLDATSIDKWDTTEINKLLPPPPVNPSSSHHGRGVLGSILHTTGQFFSGVWQGIVGIPEGGYALLHDISQELTYRLVPGGEPPPDPITALIEHPGALIGIDELKHDPAKWLGSLLPTIVTTAAGVGAESRAAEAADAANASRDAAATADNERLWAKALASKKGIPAQDAAFYKFMERRWEGLSAANTTTAAEYAERQENFETMARNLRRLDIATTATAPIDVGNQAADGEPANTALAPALGITWGPAAVSALKP